MDDRNHTEQPQAVATNGDSEKAEVEKTSTERSSLNSKKGNVTLVNRVATQEDVSLETFAHLDIRKINRKIDIRLIPVVTVLYFLSFLDRGNIGNAKIQGLVEDLSLTDTEYNLCLTVFFFTYAAFEVPSNMVLKKLRPSIWLPTLMVAWGTVMTLMGLVQGFHGLLVARLFLGVTEGGLAPGVFFYLTLWYPRQELQTRIAMFFSASAVAGAFSGLLAYAIGFMDEIGGLESWRWIFILEGLLTVVVAVAAFFLMFDVPDTASFLTPEEREYVAHRVKYGHQVETSSEVNIRIPQTDARNIKFIKDAFCDWQVWACCFGTWGFIVPLYGVSLSMPTIIKEMGYKTAKAQLMTVPVYCTAALITISVALMADHLKKRVPFLISFYFLMLLGFALCVTGGPPDRTYAGLFLVACGVYPATPCNIALLSNNVAGSHKRGAGIAIVTGMAAMGGAMASNFYRHRDAPKFILGHAINIGFVCFGLGATCFWAWNYLRINRKRAGRLAAGEHLLSTPEQLSFQGDKAVTFKYTL